MSDYYELLQVPRNADADTIKKSYRRLARQFHPDSNKSRIASEHMKLLNAANDMLSDADKRREYDARLVDAERDAAQSDAFAAQPTPAVRRRPERPWLVWVAATGLLVLLTFIGTLFALRNSLPSISLALFASPTRAVLVLPTATTTRHPTATLTPLPSPTATATSSPSATATTARPTATATTLPRTATPTRLPPTPTTVLTAIPPSPVPIVTAPILKLVTTEFPSGPNGGSDIIMSNTDGSVKINLTHSDGLSEQSPSWSPFGQHVVFSEANSGQLFVVTADGSFTSRLTPDPLMRDSNPVWAPVGSLIAFQSIARDALAAGNTQASRVFVVDFGTLQRRPIGDQPGRDLTWSPDGKWLAYQVASNSGATLYVTAVDRLSLQYYFVTPRLRRIAWTPDSNQLVYETLDRSDLYLATLQPITVQRLVGSLVVVSPRGRFPGPPVNGEFYPPIVSLVQQ